MKPGAEDPSVDSSAQMVQALRRPRHFSMTLVSKVILTFHDTQALHLTVRSNPGNIRLTQIEQEVAGFNRPMVSTKPIRYIVRDFLWRTDNSIFVSFI